MPLTWEQYYPDSVRRLVRRIGKEELIRILEGVSWWESFLDGLPLEERLNGLPIEEFVARLILIKESTGERRNERLEHAPVEKRQDAAPVETGSYIVPYETLLSLMPIDVIRRYLQSVESQGDKPVS